MDSTVSVSKGCFAFKPKGAGKKRLDDLNVFTTEPWYKTYFTVLKSIEQELEGIDNNISENVLDDLLKFISNCEETTFGIPAATLLTGINLPDHGSLFRQLALRLRADITSHVAILRSSDCTSVRGTIEQMTAQFLKYEHGQPNQKMEWNEDVEEECDNIFDDVKRSQCNLPALNKWWEELSNLYSDRKKVKLQERDKKLVVIITDFEGFSIKVLHDVILMLSGYVDRLPLVLVFGVATSVTALHNSLPHKVVSRLQLQLFQSKPSVHFLNNTVNKVFLTGKCNFQLGGKIFKFLTDVFLFYDFSVNGFVQGVKYCMMEHFYESKLSILCCNEKHLNKVITALSKDELEQIRSLLSFRKYVETQPKSEQVQLLTNSTHLKTVVGTLMSKLHDHLTTFHIVLRLLHILVASLPHAPLGKQVRELYCEVMSCKITESPKFKECFQLLNFLSKDELLEKIDKLVETLDNLDDNNETLVDLSEHLKELREEIDKVGLPGKRKNSQSPAKSPLKVDLTVKSRAELREQLMTRTEKRLSNYEIIRDKVLKYIVEEVFKTHLVPVTDLPLFEILLFDNVSAAKKHIVGIPRAALHTALNNPHHYLQCDCCELSDPGQIVASMPDICIAYKLHLESGALINMYDWLQSFVTIVSPSEEEEENCDQRQVDPKIQARFTRAVTELQFLGFVKSSKKKTDHVARLTWGGST